MRKWNIAPALNARTRDDGLIELSHDRQQWFCEGETAFFDRLEGIIGTRVGLVRYGERVGSTVAERRYSMQPIHLLSRQSLAAKRKRCRPRTVGVTPMTSWCWQPAGRSAAFPALIGGMAVSTPSAPSRTPPVSARPCGPACGWGSWAAAGLTWKSRRRRGRSAAKSCFTPARTGGQLYAVNDRCPHADASLSEGFMESGRIVCPLHFAEFDLKSGQPHNVPPGCGRLPRYRIEIRGRNVHVLH